MWNRTDDREYISREISAINAQMASLAERKRKALVKLTAANSPLNQMSPEARLEALAEVIAEGIVYLGERGQLPFPGQSEIATVHGNCRNAMTGNSKKKS